jgi:hypothetical protein
MGRKKQRFKIYSVAPTGRKTQVSADTIVEAWDWYAYYTKTAPLNEVTILDTEEEVEARA